MNRTVFVVVILLASIAANASDRFSSAPSHTLISTTGRIVKMDTNSRTMRIRPSLFNTAEYTLATTRETAFQDGADCIRFEDFNNGETISIRGILNGTVLTASRVAKWD
jgi:predicted lipoprotein